MSRILVVYYSRTSNTRRIATALANALGADLDEIRDESDRSGVFGYLRSGQQAFFRRLVSIAPPRHQPADYDLVVVGTPIWDVSLSAPVRSYLHRYASGIRAAAFFCTYDRMGMARVFRQMTQVSGREPVATLAVRKADLASPDLAARISAFGEAIRKTTPAESARRSA